MKLLLWKWKWGAWVNGHDCWESVLKSFAIDTWSNGIYRHRVLLSNPAMEDLSSMVHFYGQRERKKSCMSKNSQFFDKSILIGRVSLFFSGTRFSKAYMFLRLSPCFHFFAVYEFWKRALDYWTTTWACACEVLRRQFKGLLKPKCIRHGEKVYSALFSYLRNRMCSGSRPSS